MPGGYTPASAAPVTIRSVIPVPGPGAKATPRVARPARHAHAATSRRADQRSESVRSADTSAPATKPSCTELGARREGHAQGRETGKARARRDQPAGGPAIGKREERRYERPRDETELHRARGQARRPRPGSRDRQGTRTPRPAGGRTSDRKA